MIQSLLSVKKSILESNNFGILTEVWHEIVHWVSLNLWVLVLVATGRRADWVGTDLHIHGGSKNLLGASEVLLGRDDIVVKSWGEVVINILSWVVPLGLRLLGSHNDLVVVLSLSDGDGVSGGLNIWVATEAWDWVVDWVSLWSFWVLVLVATGGRADWVVLKLNSSGLWHNISSILILLWGPGSEFLLGGLESGLNVLNVRINTEVWH